MTATGKGANMIKKVTSRGFKLFQFYDGYGVGCSLQKSSSVEPCIWLGCDDANPRYLIPYKGWHPVNMPEGYVADTRMHLSRKDVLRLIPLLIKFVVTGEL